MSRVNPDKIEFRQVSRYQTCTWNTREKIKLQKKLNAGLKTKSKSSNWKLPWLKMILFQSRWLKRQLLGVMFSVRLSEMHDARIMQENILFC